jgi:hypothetical protein
MSIGIEVLQLDLPDTLCEGILVAILFRLVDLPILKPSFNRLVSDLLVDDHLMLHYFVLLDCV